MSLTPASPPSRAALEATTPGHRARLKDATRRYYEEHAASYAAATLHVDLSTLWEPFEAQLWRGAIVADLGCGGGRDLRRFARSGMAPIGLDRSHALCRTAWEVSGRPIVVGDLTALPFGSAAFDAVWSAAAMLHLTPAEAERAFWEIRRVLRPGGLALITLKEGEGDEIDEHGRYTRLATEEGTVAALAAADLADVGRIRTRERRSGREICWIAFLARAGPAEVRA